MCYPCVVCAYMSSALPLTWVMRSGLFIWVKYATTHSEISLNGLVVWIYIYIHCIQNNRDPYEYNYYYNAIVAAHSIVTCTVYCRVYIVAGIYRDYHTKYSIDSCLHTD